MRKRAKAQMMALGIGTLQNMGQAVETLSGGQRQAVAVARAAAFGSKVIILDEPTAALGVRESAQVLKLIRHLRERGLPVILISHNMPQVFEVADRIHVQRLGPARRSHHPAERQHHRRGRHHDGRLAGRSRRTRHWARCADARRQLAMAGAPRHRPGHEWRRPGLRWLRRIA